MPRFFAFWWLCRLIKPLARLSDGSTGLANRAELSPSLWPQFLWSSSLWSLSLSNRLKSVYFYNFALWNTNDFWSVAALTRRRL